MQKKAKARAKAEPAFPCEPPQGSPLKTLPPITPFKLAQLAATLAAGKTEPANSFFNEAHELLIAAGEYLHEKTVGLGPMFEGMSAVLDFKTYTFAEIIAPRDQQPESKGGGKAPRPKTLAGCIGTETGLKKAIKRTFRPGWAEAIIQRKTMRHSELQTLNSDIERRVKERGLKTATGSD